MPTRAETQYGKVIFEEAGHPGIEVQNGETTNVVERFKGKIQYYNQLLNVHLAVESNPDVQDIAISDGIIHVNPVTAGGSGNEDFLLLHECAHEKQRALLGFPTTEALINSFTQDLTTTELGARDWKEIYTMPPFVVSSETQSIIFDYYNGELRKSLARGIRDVHSDVIAELNMKNIYLTDHEREDGIDPRQKFLFQFRNELRANIPGYDYRDVKDTEPDFIRKIARFRAVAAGFGQSGVDYCSIVEGYDAYMKKTFGEYSRQYQVYTALSQAYLTYFTNCIKITELSNLESMSIALDSPNPFLRARAADFLGELGDVRAMEHLFQKLLIEEDLDVKTLIGDAIIEIMENNRDNEECKLGVFALLVSLVPRLLKFDLENSFTQANIAAYIGILQPGFTLRMLDTLLSDITPFFGRGAPPFIDVAILNKRGPIIGQEFHYDDPHLRAARTCVIHMIGLIGQAYPDEALKILIPWIKDRYDPEHHVDSIYYQIATEVARIGAVNKEKTINALNLLLHSDDDSKKRWGTYALEIIQGKEKGFIAELPYKLYSKSSIFETSKSFREFLRKNIRGEFK